VHPYVKWILIGVILLIVKAFFIDDYLKKTAEDANATEQTAPDAVQEPTPPKAEGDSPAPTAETNESNLSTTEKFKKESEQSLIDRGVEWLADKLAEKLH
jgi:hypothetical protein